MPDFKSKVKTISNLAWSTGKLYFFSSSSSSSSSSSLFFFFFAVYYVFRDIIVHSHRYNLAVYGTQLLMFLKQGLCIGTGVFLPFTWDTSGGEALAFDSLSLDFCECISKGPVFADIIKSSWEKNPSLAHAVYPRKDEIMVSPFTAEAVRWGLILLLYKWALWGMHSWGGCSCSPFGIRFATHQEKKDTQGC